jgi:hypothetical protein
MKAIDKYIFTPMDVQLAQEIASRLNDPTSLTQFLRFTKEVPHDYLRKALDMACAAPDHLIEVSRAAIFVSKIKSYKLYGNGNLGY